MAQTPRPATLCYLDATRVQSPAGDLASVDLRGRDDEKLGAISGVLIDPRARRLCYLVVDSPGWFRHRRCLLPVDDPARIDRDSRAMHVPLAPRDLAHCEEFDRRRTRDFGDDDVLKALFADHAA